MNLTQEISKLKKALEEHEAGGDAKQGRIQEL